MHRFSTVLAAAALAASALAQSIVIPAGTAATEGNSSNAFPWGRGGSGLLIQTIYDSSHFTNQGITYPILITGLRYRPNTNVALTASTYSQASVSLSTCPLDQASASTTLASNRGPDLMTCYSGAVSWAAQAAVPGPTPFGIVVPFTSNFLYDPSLGDLNIETDIPVQTYSGGTPQLDVQSTGALACRVYVSTGYPGTGTGTLNTSHGVVVQIDYVPATGLIAAFTGTPTTGNAPLTVNFTSQSFSSAPGGIVGYAWDFDGDNVIDSTQQNPTWIYNACGTYTVSLTVVDGTNPPDTETKVGYVVVDPLAANFTASPAGGFAPHTVQFTDTSTGPIVAWMWDFDNDTVIDSTQQNPSWIYATPGTYTVVLTVINACRQSTRTRNNLITVLAPGTVPAPPERLQYQFNEVRGQEVANTASTNAAPAIGNVNVASWWSDPNRAAFRGNEAGFGCLGYRATGAGSVNTGMPTTVTGSFSVSFWLQRDVASTGTNPFGYVFGNGTFRAFCAGAAGQGVTFRGSAIGNVDSVFGVFNTPGVWQHLTLVVDDAAGQALWYDNGVPSTNVVAFTPNTFAYTATTLFAVGALSTAGSSPIGAHYHLDDFRFYSRALLPAEVQLLALLPENASAGAAGLYCNGPGGTPEIDSAGGDPTLGNAGFAVTLANAENACLAAIAFGFTPATFGTFDLSPWLGAGCYLQTDAAALNFYITAANAATQPFPIPGSTSFAGLHVYAQWLVLGSTGAASRLLDINIR